MELKVKIGNVDATFICATAQEAADLMRLIAGSSRQPETVNEAVDGEDGRSDATRLNDALNTLKGTTAAKLLIALADADDFQNYSMLRKTLGLGEKTNLGPIIANISKALKPERISKSFVLLRRVTRPVLGRNTSSTMWFKLTPIARAAVKAFPDFAEKPPLNSGNAFAVEDED